MKANEALKATEVVENIERNGDSTNEVEKRRRRFRRIRLYYLHPHWLVELSDQERRLMKERSVDERVTLTVLVQRLPRLHLQIGPTLLLMVECRRIYSIDLTCSGDDHQDEKRQFSFIKTKRSKFVFLTNKKIFKY